MNTEEKLHQLHGGNDLSKVKPITLASDGLDWTRDLVNVNEFREMVCWWFWKVKIMHGGGKNPQGNKAGTISKPPFQHQKPMHLWHPYRQNTEQALFVNIVLPVPSLHQETIILFS